MSYDDEPTWEDDEVDLFDAYEFDEEDPEKWTCAYPNECIIPDPHHPRSECCTAEDMEQMYKEGTL